MGATSHVGPTGKTITDSDLSVLTADQVERANNNEYSYYSTNEYGQELHQSVVIDGKTFYIQVPTDGINEDTRFCIIQGGDGGVLSDSKAEYVSTQDKNVVLITTSSISTDDYSTSEKIIEDLATSYGANPKNRQYMGHSISGELVTNRASEYLISERENGEQTRASIVINDSSGLKKIFQNGDDSIEAKVNALDDSLIVGTINDNYFSKDSEGNLRIVDGSRLDAYNEDLEKIALAGGNVILAAYVMGGDPHTLSVGMSAAMGLDDLTSAQLASGSYGFTDQFMNAQTCSGMNYYYFDTSKKQWVEFETVEAAQSYLDYSEGKVELYNNGFLEKNNGAYYLKTPDGLEEISEMDLENIILSYKNSDDEEIQNMSLEEYISSKIGPGSGRDSAEFNLVNTGRAVESLASSLASIGGHMKSLTNINGLNTQAKGTSKFLSSCPSFPSGVNTSAFMAANDCISAMGKQIETAYNAALGVHNALLNAEGLAPTYYQSNTYAHEAAVASSATSNFASDNTNLF